LEWRKVQSSRFKVQSLGYEQRELFMLRLQLYSHKKFAAIESVSNRVACGRQSESRKGFTNSGGHRPPYNKVHRRDACATKFFQ
jgi:hypothetical protein